MPKLSPEQQAIALQQLAERIDQAGWRSTAAFALDVVGPLDVIASQLVAISRPLVAGYTWEVYAEVLSEPAGWQTLRQIITREAYTDE